MEKKRGLGVSAPGPRIHPSPSSLGRPSGQKTKDGPMNSTTGHLPPGALLLAQQFQPKHRLSITDVCPVLGLSRDGLYKRIRTGKIALRIRKDELGRQFVLLFDLIAYLFPEVSDSLTALPSGTLEPPANKRKRGRPPGSGNKPKTPLAGGDGEGGAR